MRFDQTGNIRKNITFEQVAKITQTIASKMEHDWFYIAPRNISIIVRYLEIVAKEVELSSGVMKFISELKSCASIDNKALLHSTLYSREATKIHATISNVGIPISVNLFSK